MPRKVRAPTTWSKDRIGGLHEDSTERRFAKLLSLTDLACGLATPGQPMRARR